MDEDENVIKFGRGKHTIMVGKNQLEEVLRAGFKGKDALMELARRQGISWIPGGALCKLLVAEDIRDLMGMGIDIEQIKQHYQKKYPLAYKACILGEELTPEEQQLAEKKALDKVLKKPSNVVEYLSGEDPELAAEDGSPLEPEKPEDAENAIKTLVGHITAAEGACCGADSAYVTMANAIESLAGQATAKVLQVDYVQSGWDHARLYGRCVDAAGSEAKFLQAVRDNVPAHSLLGKLMTLIDDRELWRKYLCSDLSEAGCSASIDALVRLVVTRVGLDELLDDLESLGGAT